MTDYTSILSDVATYMNRSDLTAEIPYFITRAENDMNTFLAQNPVRPMVTTATGSVTTASIELPADFIDIIGLELSDGTDTWNLARVSNAARFSYYESRILPPGIGFDSEEPVQFKISASAVVLNTAPPASRTYSLVYYAKLEALTSTNSTNWLSDNHGDVYLFGTLAHAALRVRDMPYYNEVKNLFLGGLGAIPSAYPERAIDTSLRALDGPWSRASAWNINSD